MSIVYARVYLFTKIPIEQPLQSICAMSMWVTLLSTFCKRDNFILLDSYVFHGLQLCIPDYSLHEYIVWELYSKGHFGWDNRLALVSANYC